LKITWR